MQQIVNYKSVRTFVLASLQMDYTVYVYTEHL